MKYVTKHQEIYEVFTEIEAESPENALNLLY